MATKANSYCQEATDCGLQNIIHPMCVGNFTCTEESTCGYHCGIAVVPVPMKCMSSGSCAADEFCTTEHGVCDSTGILAVCSGTCEKGERAPL